MTSLHVKFNLHTNDCFLHFGKFIKGNFSQIYNLGYQEEEILFFNEDRNIHSKNLMIYTFCIHNALCVCLIHDGFENTICDW